MLSPCAASTGISAAISARCSGAIIAARSRLSTIRIIATLRLSYARAYRKHVHINDLLVHHRTVVQASIAVVAHVQADDLGRPTPCVEWTLADLLAHLIAQHRGFAAAARGSGGDPDAWQVRPIG